MDNGEGETEESFGIAWLAGCYLTAESRVVALGEYRQAVQVGEGPVLLIISGGEDVGAVVELGEVGVEELRDCFQDAVEMVLGDDGLFGVFIVEALLVRVHG